MNIDPLMFFLLVGLGGYLLGSVPFGLVFTRLAGLGDIRKIGSGNIGVTNVLRTGRKDLALLTLIFDIGKAALAAYIAMLFALPENKELAGLIAGTCGVIGHNFPVWLKFKGGKGVAATLGMMLVTAPFVGLAAVGTWLLTAVVFRYSSLAALVALTLAPVYAYFLAQPMVVYFFSFLAVLALVRHKDNIKRLASGKESKIGRKKS